MFSSIGRLVPSQSGKFLQPQNGDQASFGLGWRSFIAEPHFGQFGAGRTRIETLMLLSRSALADVHPPQGIFSGALVAFDVREVHAIDFTCILGLVIFRRI